MLVKSHSQADIIEKELKKKNIPSIKKVNTGFFKEPVIKNVISALSLIKNTENEQALFRLLKTSLSDSQIYALKKNLDEKLLKQLEKDVDVVIPKFSKTYKFLPAVDEIKEQGRMETYDLAIALDCGDIKRLNGFSRYFEYANCKISIEKGLLNGV